MFSLPESSTISIINGEYSISLVIISIIISCCAAYTALSMNQRIQQGSFFNKNFWLVLSSLAMGIGIWSMHFIGMSAFMLPVPMKYDILLTVLSAIPAVLASYLAFYVASKLNTTPTSYMLAGLLMGAGISSMHYIGMAAMRMDIDYFYQPWLFIFSMLISVIVSYIALYIFSTLQKYMNNQLVKIMTSILLGLAISSMHYTGMHATVFYAEDSMINSLSRIHLMNMTLLVIVITVGTLLLLLMSGLTGLLDGYVDDRLRYFDALTLLPNQRQFEKEFYHVKTPGSLAIIEIYNLEKWIARHGYTFTDEVIKTIGKLIQQHLPNYTKIYRMEGNRFVLFQLGKSEYKYMKKAVETILSTLKKPLLVDNQLIVTSAVCAMTYSDEKAAVKELFSNSMSVLKHHSIEYKHEIIDYDPRIHTYTFEKQILRDTKRAMINNELYLEYQPKIHLETYKVSGLEALVRWKHPVYGKLSPGIFIPILEKNEEIFKVTDWIIEKVCKQIAEWIRDGVPFQQVSINIPGSYVTSSRLLNTLLKNSEKYQVNSHFIELEITETSVINNIDNAINTIDKYRQLGFSVALDDFGTGLSSLSYLKRLPISTIKIDKSFVDGVLHSEKDSAMLEGIITLCYSLNLGIIIEGVESKEQMNFIKSVKESLQIQGFYFSRPLENSKIAAWIGDENYLLLKGS